MGRSDRGLSRRSVLRLGAGVGTGALLGGCGASGGDGGPSFPDRPVEFVVPFATGGSTDQIARTLVREIEEPLGQQMLIVNRVGAAGALGTREVVGGPPDGYRLAFAPSSLFTLSPQLEKTPTGVSLDEIRVITGLTVENIVLVAHRDSPFQTLDDLLALQRSGKRIRYGHSGVGTGAYFAQTAFYKLAGIDATDVPLGGGGPTVTAVLGKQVDIAASQPTESMKLVESGDLRWLAVFSAQRSPLLPDIPTAVEKGFDLTVDQVRFVAAPRSTPEEAVLRLRKAFQQAVTAAAYDKFLKANRIDRFEMSGEEIRAKIAQDRDHYQDLIQRFGLRPK